MTGTSPPKNKLTVKDMVGYIKRMNEAVEKIDKAIQEAREEYNSFLSHYKGTLKEKE